MGVVVLGSVLACGRSGYQYIENDDLGLYARVPHGWTVYDERDLFPDASDRRLDDVRERTWVRSFDASPDPSVEASQNPGNADPTGLVVVRALTPDERDALDLSALRGGGNPARDPVAQDEAGSTVDVLVNEPVEFDGGFSGVHMVFTTSGDGPLQVVDRTAVRDAATTMIAVLEVGCHESCYFESHGDEIADLVDSWTFQEVR
jgi:hypothetical protein